MIRESFLDLLKEREASKITVTEICTRAEINRATFYRYYDNPLALLDAIEAELLDGLQEKIRRLPAAEPSAIFRSILEDILARREIYLTLFSENGDAMFKQRVFEQCYPENMETIRTRFPGLAQDKQQWFYYFIAEGCTGILNRWLSGGMREPPEEIVGFLTALIDALNRAAL